MVAGASGLARHPAPHVLDIDSDCCLCGLAVFVVFEFVEELGEGEVRRQV